jgi:hypothetical protein
VLADVAGLSGVPSSRVKNQAADEQQVGPCGWGVINTCGQGPVSAEGCGVMSGHQLHVIVHDLIAGPLTGGAAW